MITFLLTMCLSHAAEVHFDYQVVSKAPLTLKFQAPKDHHFNQEAPAKVDIEGSDQTAKLDRSLQVVKAQFASGVKGKNCKIRASLYVCNNDNTYCLPVKQEYDCNTL